MQDSKLGVWKGYYLSIEDITKGVPFLPKMIYKRERGWTTGRSLPVENIVEHPPEDIVSYWRDDLGDFFRTLAKRPVLKHSYRKNT